MVTNKFIMPIAQNDRRKSTFGVGRSQMQKLHVDEILYKGLDKDADSNPGPGQHNLDKEWVQPKDTSLSKTTPQFTFTRASKGEDGHFNR